MQAFDIEVNLGRKAILHQVDFQAEPGEVTAIVGPNGSGKTTLLRAMTGEIAYAGKVLLNGNNVSAMSPVQLAAIRGVQPQTANIAFPFTVLEIVRLGLTTGLSAAETELPLKALEKVDLGGFGHRMYQDLSGGEQQRVQLARVLTQIWQPVIDGTPRWLILDEPVASLDIGHQFTVMDLTRDFASRGGGVVTVMHDLNLTAMFADKVVLMHGGRIAAQGSPQHVLTSQTLTQAYGCPVPINSLPADGAPFLLPQARQTEG